MTEIIADNFQMLGDKNSSKGEQKNEPKQSHENQPGIEDDLPF